MRITGLSICMVVLFLTSIPVACGNSETTIFYTDEVKLNECGYENPIDSIIHNTTEDIRYDEVCRYLAKYPGFINQSDSVGYHRYSCDDCERQMIWKDCGDIRVYSIPCPSMYSTYCCNFVQFRKKGGIDTIFLKGNGGNLENLYELRNKSGRTNYVLKSRLDVCHQGIIVWEYISAFSVEGGRLAKENLFHAKNQQYDSIAVECGGQRYLPLDYQNVVLISMNHFEDNDDNPAFVIAEINNNDWPTGYGLKYEWNGNWFEYVGKCQYDVDGFYR